MRTITKQGGHWTCKTETGHPPITDQEEAPRDLCGTAIGRELPNVPAGGHSKRYYMLKRAPLHGVCPTVNKGGGGRGTAGSAHPHENRKFSIPELKRLCGFPDDFVLVGSHAQRWAVLGNSVPPMMMMHVAGTVRKAILEQKGGTSHGP